MKRETIAKSAVDRNKEEIEMSTKDKNAVMNEGLKNRSYCLAVKFIILVALSINTFAQNRPVHVSDGYTPAGMAYGGFALDGIGRVNEFNGSLSVALPLGTVAGRGESGFQMNLRIEKNWLVRHFDFSPPIQTAHPMYHVYAFDSGPYASIRKPGFGPGIVVARRAGDIRYGSVQYPGVAPRYCATLSRVSFVGSDGSEIELRDRETNGTPNGVSGGSYTLDDNSTPLNRGNYFDSKDGSSITFISDSDIVDPSCADVASGNSQYLTGYPSGYLLFPNGTKYRVENGNVTLITDRNGNKTAIEYSTISYRGLGSQVTKITDSLGREIYISYSSTATTITKKGTAGEDRVIQINYANKPLRSDHSAQTLRQLFPSITWCATQNGCAITGVDNTYTEVGVTSVDLPNGQSYEFSYDPYGEVARIDLPTGGAFEYDYIGQYGAYSSQGEIITNYVSSGLNDWAISRRVSKQRIYNTGNLLQTETTYTNDGSPGINIKTRNASSALLAHSRVQFQGAAIDSFGSGRTPVTYDPQFEGRPLVRDEYDLSGNILRTQEFTWEQTGSSSKPENERLDEKQLTLVDANLVASETYEYDSYGNTTDVREYDYGSGQAGSFLRRTHTDFVTSSNYVSDSGPFIRRLPSQNWVSSDSAGSNKVSLIQFEYDDYSSNSTHAGLTSRGSVTGHDSTNFGTSFVYRGNTTAITSYTNASSTSGAISEYLQYDQLGNVVKTIDGNSNAITLSYSDNFGSADSNATTNSTPSQISGYSTFAFPTSTTNPYPFNWISYVQYDYFTGQPVNTQDFNGIISKTIYNDDLDRPTQTVANVGITGKEIQTTIEYDDANRRVEKTSDLFMLNDNLARAESYYDGLGRTIETRDYKDGDYVSVKTEYDPLGRVYRTSNPYRPSRSESLLWTENTFDALGRVTEIETPDTAQVKTAYDGNRTLVADQAGKKRISKTNALGQLTDVWEITSSDGSTVSVSFPGSLGSGVSYGYQTSYGYDVLGNLVHVDQGTQDRDFVYDSLSRLTSATNPESGTITYTYDSNGNIKTHRDARNIKTVYDYDALNRVTERCYRSIGSGSLGMTTCVSNNETAEANTSDVNYTYEDSNVTNLKNVLTEVTNGTSTTEYTSFDAIGRITGHKQTTDSVQYTTGYSYYLSGALNEETYHSGRVVKNVFDTADGSLSQVQSKRSGDTYRNYANDFIYNAAGATTAIHLGNGRWENTTFNNRLQPTVIGLGSGPMSQNILKLEYSYGDWVSGSIDSTKNNGNIVKQIITAPTVGSNSGFTATQKYYYDSLNRLDDATEDVSSSQKWRQDFAYDRYGNRTFVEANTTTLPKECNGNTTVCTEDIPKYNPTIASGNKLTGTQYDASGNVSTDAFDRVYSYDGENHQVQVDQWQTTLGMYSYDGNRRRVKKHDPDSGETTIFVYDAFGKLVAEYDTTVQTGSNAKISYTTNDHLGSSRINTDAIGQTIARHDYHPFGEEITTSERISALGYTSDTIRKKFTGYERDSETGLDFAQARYFNSPHGRFSSPDSPFVDQSRRIPQSWNLYTYVRNNPLNLVDPSGFSTGCPPGSVAGCYERGGKYFVRDESGNELELDNPIEIKESQNERRSIGGSPIGMRSLVIPPGCLKQPCTASQLDPGILPIPMGGVVNRGIGSFLSRLTRWLGFGRAASQFANGITRQMLEEAATAAGPTIRVVTNLTQAPQAGRALSVAVGEGAEALASTARSSGNLFTGNIPKALIEHLKTAGLVEERITMMGGIKGTELYFRPEATEFIVQFFKQ